jgi:hypothetical protein
MSDTKLNNFSSSTSTHDHPPRLTDDECHLLMEHQGCLKCHQFYVGHCANECSTTFSGKGYKPDTERDAQHTKNNAFTKATSSQITTVAAVSDATAANHNDDFIAAVFPSLSSTVISEGSLDDSDASFASVSPPPPIKSKHFIWNCILTSPLVTFPMKKPALINNGCQMVLIHPNLVEQLGLQIFTLKQPEEVDVAISFLKTGIAYKRNSLVNYVKLHPYSHDSICHSHQLHAVICPGLCMPLIFGLPFLELNDVTCDHKNNECIVQDKNLNYNLLKPIMRQPTPPPKTQTTRTAIARK